MKLQLLNIIRSNTDYRRLFENFISLSILQGLNYILPFITFPYQVRVLGIEKLGLLSFVMATIGCFQILTDYGFNLSATRMVAIYRENKEKLEEIFSSVMIAKAGLFIVSLLLMTILVFSFEKFRTDWYIYYLAFGMVLGQVLFPVWFFQGMERMRYITFLNILAKGFFTIAIFIFVKKQEDYWKIPLLNTIGFVVTGVVSLWLIKRKYNVKITLKNVSKFSIVSQLRDGLNIFLSNVTGSIYGQGTVFFLGIIVNDNTIVGYYSVAEKLMKIIAGLSQPIAQSYYPFYANKNKSEVRKKVKKILFYSALMSIMYLVFMLILGKYVYYYLIKNKNVIATCIYFIISVTGALTIMNVIKQPLIYIFNKDKENFFMYLFVSLSFILINLILTTFFSAIGTAISLLYVETMILCVGLIIIYKKKKTEN